MAGRKSVSKDQKHVGHSISWPPATLNKLKAHTRRLKISASKFVCDCVESRLNEESCEKFGDENAK